MPSHCRRDSPTGDLPIVKLLDRWMVRARVRLSGWEGAVEAAGALLLESGCIEPRYIESMKRVLREMGPYAVIAPGIVLLHARPEDGVRKPCFALLTLATPVRFGHSQNDPVDIVLAFGAVDKQAHVEALQQLAQLLADPQDLAALRAAPDDRALLACLRSRSRGRPLARSRREPL